jgi:uncharacterized protein (UPF0548 family)
MIMQLGGLALGPVDEAALLDGLPARAVNYDPADAPPDGETRPGHRWHVESAAVLVGTEPPGDPVPDGPWQLACALASRYEFADPEILRAVYRAGSALDGRDMLMEGRFYGLRFYFGVRVTRVFDQIRVTPRGPERVWGWCYETLQGHLEQGRINFEVIKNLATGQIAFRVAGFARPARLPSPAAQPGCPARLPSPVVRLGFRLFGRWMQQRYYRAVRRRLYDLVLAGAPPPAPGRTDGLVTAPATAGTNWWDRFAPGWLYPGP